MHKDIPEELLEALLDNLYEGLILVDSEGIVRFMSSSNEGVLPNTGKRRHWKTHLRCQP